MAHWLLRYRLAPDYLPRRASLREAHLRHAWAAADRGELLLGGALDDPADEAVLLFAGGSAEAAERFAAADPYVAGGLVEAWSVRRWTTVAGAGAATPVHPDKAGAAPYLPRTDGRGEP